MSAKKVTFTVMHDKGEDINGKNIRPYETFQAVPTDELDEKVSKGWLVEGTLSAEAEAIAKGGEITKKAKKSSRKR